MSTFVSLTICMFLLVSYRVDMEKYNLIKRTEQNLYRPQVVEGPWSRGYSPRPLFSRLPTGEIFLIERGTDRRGAGYFFSKDGELNRMIILLPPGANGKPGTLSGTSTVFRNSDSEFGSYDNSYRLNLFDPQGELSRSLLVPIAFQSSIFITATFNQNLLALGGLHIKDTFLTPLVLLMNYDSLSTAPLTFSLCEDAYGELKSKGAQSFFGINVTSLSDRRILCTIGHSSDIYLLFRDGTLLEEKTIPTHFQPLRSAPCYESAWDKPDEKGRLSAEAEQWLTVWTHTYPGYELSGDRFLVPRVLYPVFNLDLYSYSDRDIKYLGYASTDKEFLFADSSGIYLLEGKDDTSIVVGRYEIVPSNFREEQGIGWATMQLSAEQLTGIRRVAPDTIRSDTCEPCDREKRRPKGYRSTIENIKLISADSVEYSLKNSLAPDKDHIIVFGAPQDCPLDNVLRAAERFVAENPNSDLTLVFTHPYAGELNEFLKLAQTNWIYPILGNLDYKRLEPILKSQVCFLVVSKDGTITASADYPGDYPDFVPKPR